MLPGNIACPFMKKASFIILETNSECSYYLEAQKKNRNFISNFITWNLRDKSTIKQKNHDFLTQNSKQIYISWTLISANVKCLSFAAFCP